MEYITASCVIRDREIRQNGQLVLRQPGAGLADFLLAAYQHFGAAYPKFYKMDPLSKLGWLAAEGLLAGGFAGGPYDGADIAVVLSNAHSSLDTDYRYFSTMSDIASPALFVYTLPNIVIGEISIRHKLKGKNAFFIFDAFDPVFTRDYAGELLDRMRARACICGWVDVLAEEYSAALFLVEREAAGPAFTADNMTAIMNLTNNGNA